MSFSGFIFRFYLKYLFSPLKKKIFDVLYIYMQLQLLSQTLVFLQSEVRMEKDNGRRLVQLLQ